MPATVSPPTAPALDRTAFLAGVRASGVVAGEKLDRAVDDLPPSARSAREVAEWWVEVGLLSRYQAERLLVGRSEGFVLGQYVIVDHIGKSATGRVFKAKHRTMNRWVTVKLLASALSATDPVRDAVRADARRAARLTHPNVITLLDVNQVGDRMYLVKEYLDGASVAAALRASGRLTLSQAGDVIRQAALGLQHAHEKDIPHGRISPTAILIGQPNRAGATERPPVKVSGFGLGRFAAEADAQANDFEYRAPEQFDRPDLTAAPADVYALGCVFFHLLTGQPPFPAATPRDAANGHRLQAPPPVTYFRPEVPPGVVALIAAMLAKNPAARPTAEQVATRLAVFADATAGDAIDLNLPPVSYSAATSILQPLSGTHAPPPAASSPFAELTAGAADPHERTPVAVAKGKTGARLRRTPARAARRGRTGLHPMAALSVLLLIAIGVALALTVLLKRAVVGP